MQSFEVVEHLEALRTVLESAETLSFLQGLQEFHKTKLAIRQPMRNALASTGDANSQAVTLNSYRNALQDAKNNIKAAIKPSQIFPLIQKLRIAFSAFEDNFQQEVNEVNLGDLDSQLLEFQTIYENFLEDYSFPSIVELLDSGISLSYALNNIKGFIYSVWASLQENYKYDSSLSSFSLFLDSDYTYADFLKKLEVIQVLYSELCSLLDVSESEFPLKIAKIESGSLFVKIFGQPKAIELMSSLVKDTVGFFYRNRTTEGKIASIPQKIDALEAVIGLKAKLEEAGVNTGELSDELAKASVTIAKGLNSLLEDEVGVEVNGEKLQIEGSRRRNLLEGRKQLMIEAAKDDVAEDEQPSDASS